MKSIYTHICIGEEHYHHQKLDLTEIEPVKNRNYVKPDGGFWLSINNDWERWCESEMPEWLNGDRYEVRLITVESGSDLDMLPKQVPEVYRGMPKELLTQFLADDCFLDFEELAKSFDVIEVYTGSDRELYLMLYGWDCDSALVLDPNVIEVVRKIEPCDADPVII